ncbi:LacI family transcriptional regulator, partial [Bacillus vallismortis]|nr:LacI family transcriptional regulator [Bacillus vallismortis]
QLSVLGAQKLLSLIREPETKAETIFEHTEFKVRDSVRQLTM